MTHSSLPASTSPPTPNHKFKFAVALLVLVILSGGFFGVDSRDFTKYFLDSSIHASWGPYTPDTNLSGYLYMHEYNGTSFFLSTEDQFTESLLTLPYGTLTLLKESPFFNPNACAKMPNVAWKQFLFFRDYEAKTPRGFTDIIYAYNRDTHEILEFRPPFKIVGDIYTAGEKLYFFFTPDGIDIHLAWTTESIMTFSTSFITSEFTIENMQFYGGEPAFSYQESWLKKYRFDIEETRFVEDASYVKTQRIMSDGSGLKFVFPGSSYSFVDSKQFRDVRQILYIDEVVLLQHTGALSVYPIGQGAK